MNTLALVWLVMAASDAQAERIVVGGWGGDLEEILRTQIFAGFTEATGIEVRAVDRPADLGRLAPPAQPAHDSANTVDVMLVSDGVLAVGRDRDLWADLDRQAMPSTSFLEDGSVVADNDGTYAVGAFSFYTSFVLNTDLNGEGGASWAELWSGDWGGKLGLPAQVNAGLLEITALAHFGDYDILQTRAGLEQVIAKISELKPDVGLWYADESLFYQEIVNGEIDGGVWFHDAAMQANMRGAAVTSAFPGEGAVLRDAFWVVPHDSRHQNAAQKFIEYMSRPLVQTELARQLGVTPVAKESLLNLTEEELSVVVNEQEPIRVQTEIYLHEGNWLLEAYREMVSQ